MNSNKNQYQELEEKYNKMKEECQTYQEQLGRYQQEIFNAREKLKQQSCFCASLGSTLGNLLWKTSRDPYAPRVLIEATKTDDFLCIVSGTVNSFIETYKDELPDQYSDESQFVLSLVGVVTNMAATSEGRAYFCSKPNGQEVITCLVQLLNDIPLPSGHCLKRLMLMFLYNISINIKGQEILQQETTLIKTLSDILNDKQSLQELQILSLKLLQSITFNCNSEFVYKNILKDIPKGVLETFLFSKDEEVQKITKSVCLHIEKMKEMFLLNQETQNTS